MDVDIVSLDQLFRLLVAIVRYALLALVALVEHVIGSQPLVLVIFSLVVLRDCSSNDHD